MHSTGRNEEHWAAHLVNRGIQWLASYLPNSAEIVMFRFENCMDWDINPYRWFWNDLLCCSIRMIADHFENSKPMLSTIMFFICNLMCHILVENLQGCVWRGLKPGLNHILRCRINAFFINVDLVLFIFSNKLPVSVARGNRGENYQNYWENYYSYFGRLCPNIKTKAIYYSADKSHILRDICRNDMSSQAQWRMHMDSRYIDSLWWEGSLLKNQLHKWANSHRSGRWSCASTLLPSFSSLH